MLQLESVDVWYQDNMQHVLYESNNTQHKLEKQKLVFQTMSLAWSCEHIFKSHVLYEGVDGKFELVQIFIDMIWYHFSPAGTEIWKVNLDSSAQEQCLVSSQCIIIQRLDRDFHWSRRFLGLDRCWRFTCNWRRRLPHDVRWVLWKSKVISSLIGTVAKVHVVTIVAVVFIVRRHRSKNWRWWREERARDGKSILWMRWMEASKWAIDSAT